MKVINFLDPAIKRKKDLTNKNYQLIKNTKLPLPSEVEISESGVCNRKCGFCPRSAPDFKEVKEFISPQLHTKLIDQLKIKEPFHPTVSEIMLANSLIEISLEVPTFIGLSLE